MMHQRNQTFLEMFPSCEKEWDVLFYRYKETSSKGDSKKDEGFPIIFRLYKIVRQTK